MRNAVKPSFLARIPSDSVVVYETIAIGNEGASSVGHRVTSGMDGLQPNFTLKLLTM